MDMTMLLCARRISPVSTRSLVAATAVALGAAAAVAVIVRRVEVHGDSMRPTLLPGDRVVALRSRAVRAGDVVVVTDPRVPSRSLVKRVVAVGPGGIRVAGDAPDASTDSRHFGPVPAVWGRVVYRYAPRPRAGRLS